MSDISGALRVEMPGPSHDPELEHLWRLIGAHLCCRVELSYPCNGSGVYRVSRVGQSTELIISRQTSASLPGHWCVRTFGDGQRNYEVLSPCSEDSPPQRSGNQVSVSVDLLAALISLLRLEEEQDVPLRDRFGLVEARNSPRGAMGALSTPLVENLAEWIGAVLGVPSQPAYPHGASWAVAVTCDVDVLEDDHLPRVIDRMVNYGVQEPTFMVCAVGKDERTCRDPMYDIADSAVKSRLRPLRDSGVEVGLHGSYLAHDRLTWLQSQRSRLEDCVGRSVRGHRSHFLRFAYLRSWAWQFRAGFLYDLSLGYPDAPGLRSGSASPLLFHDPEKGDVPFVTMSTCVLDQHFFWPRKWQKEEVLTYLETLVRNIALARGVLVLDWHTYTFNREQYPGWWDSLDSVLSMARNSGAFLAGSGTIAAEYVNRYKYLFRSSFGSLM